MEPRHAHSELIDAIGPEAVRRTLGVSSAVLSNWRRRGVPAAQRLDLARLLIAGGHAVPADILDPATVQGLRLARAAAEVAAATRPMAAMGDGFAG